MRYQIVRGIILGICAVVFLTGCSGRKSEESVGVGIQGKEEKIQEQGQKMTALNVTKEELCRNDFILYQVLCGSSEVGITTDELEMGLLQSVYDQERGIDEVTGTIWGYNPKDYMVSEEDRLGEGRNQSKWIIEESAEYVPEETGFYYDFELQEGTYEVTCGFYNPFNARTVTIDSEGETEVEDLKILKYKENQVVFEQTVTDGMLSLFVYNPDRGSDHLKNPILSYIIIRLVPESYDAALLSSLLKVTKISEQTKEDYSSQTMGAYEEAYTLVQMLISQDTTEWEDDNKYEEAYKKLKTAYEGLKKIQVYDSFTPGETWYDDDGTLIQAHGGHVQRLKVKDKRTGELVEKWWWVGEDKTNGYRGGICAYSSEDLYNWTYEGMIMRNVTSREQLDTEDYFKNLYADYTEKQLDNVYICINDTTSVIERPKMIFNEETGKYLLWFHADGPTETSNANYAAASAGVAVSDSPYGPFRFIDRYRLNVCPEDQEDMYPSSKGMARDMNLFIDDDKTAYIIYSSEENLTIYISKLNDTYTGLATPAAEAVYGEDFIRLYPGAQREAPAVFKRNGIYYMMTSGATGWAPNKARYYMSDSMLGEWVNMGDPCIGDDKQTTFDSQSTCIFSADKESDSYIYMGDRWNSDDLSNSRYVWLPIQFDVEGKMTIQWVDSWSIDEGM